MNAQLIVRSGEIIGRLNATRYAVVMNFASVGGAQTKQIKETLMMNKKVNAKTLAGALALLLASGLTALAGNDNRAPEVPAQIAVDSTTNKVHFHGFGVGVQIYTWDGSAWTGPVPEATLFDDEGNIVAIHFAGPTWESNSGSQVRGAVVQPTVTIDTNAIPWVRLRAVSSEGPGIFDGTTFIQRVNTTGGRAPSVNGTVVGEVARSPYTADYFFYRRSND